MYIFYELAIARQTAGPNLQTFFREPMGTLWDEGDIGLKK